MKKIWSLVTPGKQKPKQAFMGNSVQKIKAKESIQAYPLDPETSQTSCKKLFMGEIECLQPTKHLDHRRNESFHSAIGSMLVMAQFFAIMPVIGVKSDSVANLRFKWRSVRTIYSMIVFTALSAYMGITLWIALSQTIQFDRTVALAFYTSAVCAVFLFGTLAKEWPSLMQKWESVECQLPKFRDQKERNMLARKIKILTVFIMMTSLVEHILNNVTIFYYVSQCLRQKNLLEEAFSLQSSQLFTFTSFTAWKAFIGKYLNVVATFMWNFMDLFIIVISVGLSTQFKQINEDLMRVKGEHMSEEFWALRRTQYQHLSSLCFDVDKAISKITLVSISNNLFFVCVQLLQSLRPMPSVVHAVYFWFSFTFLIIRTLAVSLYATAIHDESKKPIQALRAVPSSSWCLEVRRYTEQVVQDTIALSGMQFFYLTRRFILSVAGTIATYELVLYQFYKDDKDQPLCRGNY